MKKFLNYISIALLAVTLFSCNKNEWTKENETEFKEGFKEGMINNANGLLSEDQINFIADCTTEKLKAKGIKMNDVPKPENIAAMKIMAKECTEEWMSKNTPSSPTEKGETSWNPKNEETYKAMLKQLFIKSGAKSDAATYISECAITKFKEKNIGPADLEKPENGDLVQKIGTICGQEWAKKK